MRGTIAILLFLSLLQIVLAAPVTAQSKPQSAPSSDASHKAPDLVCFGNNPGWSIQFTKEGARYVGMNESNRIFMGGLNWVPAMNAWSWNPSDIGQRAPLTAVIKKASCVDNVRNWTVPYSAQVNLPEGDMVSGCCRKLKPGEGPVGPGGYSPSQPPPQ